MTIPTPVELRTAHEIEALPEGSIVLVPTYGNTMWVWRRDALGGLYTSEGGSRQEAAAWILDRYGPVTVIWIQETQPPSALPTGR